MFSGSSRILGIGRLSPPGPLLTVLHSWSEPQRHGGAQLYRLPRSVKLCHEERFVRQGDAVLPSHDLIGQPIECIPGECLILLRAENKSDRWVLSVLTQCSRA